MLLREMCADCLTCFNLKITFDVRDMVLNSRERCLEVRFRPATKRDRITRIRCSRNMILNNDGLPKHYKSSAALRGCASRTELKCSAYDSDADE